MKIEVRRRQRVCQMFGLSLDTRLLHDPRPWHGVVCSRLGRRLIDRHLELAAIRHYLEEAHSRGEVTIIVPETGSAPWVRRAAELLGVGAIEVPIDRQSLRDVAAVWLVDRLDVAFVRPRGKIFSLVLDRLSESDESSDPSSVRVALSSRDPQPATQLMAAGAVGYFLAASILGSSPPLSSPPCDSSPRADPLPPAAESLVRQPEAWLVHSTRARTGPWPGQSSQQFVDWLLMTDADARRHSPLEPLRRIITQQRLVGSHRTISSDRNVVCFSSRPILDWLAGRTHRSHLGRWDAEPFGIAISRAAAIDHGAVPVIYGGPEQCRQLPPQQRWRFQATGKTYDWASEKEWRVPGVVDLSQFAFGEVIVFVPDQESASALGPCHWPVLTVERLAQMSL